MNFESRRTPSLRQQGNTLVGVIIGLVIGLIIAVIVALAITKGSTPFTEKSGKAARAAEASGGQVADPNKPMYGNKEASRAAARNLTKEARPAPPDALQQAIDKLDPEPAREARPEARAELKPEVKAEAKPEARAGRDAAKVPVLDKSKPAPVAAKADAADEKWVYYLQAGAFREMEDAESTRAKLALMGFEASVTERSTDIGVLHRVRTGPYKQLDAMNRVRAKLSENGIDVAVVRNQK